MTFLSIGAETSASRWRRTSGTSAETPAASRIQELRRQLAASGASLSTVPELASLSALAGESSAEVFYHSLLYLGRQAAARGSERAGIYFQFLESMPREGFWAIPEAIRREAGLELQTLQGNGHLGRRLERAGRTFANDVMDPGMLIGMGVAGTVFSGLRLGVLSRMAARPASFWSRGAAAQFLAGGLAFPGEVGSFWLTNRLYQQAVHPERVNWSGEAIAHELLGTTLTLGLLKLGGAASRGIFDRVHGFNPLTGSVARLPGIARFSRPFFHQAGMYAGIVGGHWSEMQLGLRPQTSTDGLLVDSLVMLANFHVAGRLSQGIMGPRHAALLQEMAVRTQRVSAPPPRFGDWLSGFGSGFNVSPLRVGAGETRFPTLMASRPEPGRELNVFMVGSGEGNGKDSGSISVTPTSENGHWDLTPPLEAALRTLRENDQLPRADRVRIAAELYRHYNRVRDILQRNLTAEVENQYATDKENFPARIENIVAALGDIQSAEASRREEVFSALSKVVSAESRRSGEPSPWVREIIQWLDVPNQILTERTGEGLQNGPPALSAEAVTGVRESLLSIFPAEVENSYKNAKNQISIDIAWTLHRIKRNHFETISDGIQAWFERFRFLQTELRRRSERGNRRQRREIRRLFDSVSLKLLETRRYHFDAESYIAEDKGDLRGPSPKSAFSDRRYPDLQRRFSDISERLRQYVEKRPLLGKILESYDGRPMARYEAIIAPNAVESEFAQLNNPQEIQDLFRQAVVECDPILTGLSGIPLYRLLRQIQQQTEPGLYLNARSPLDQYLLALSGIRERGGEWDELESVMSGFVEVLEKAGDVKAYRDGEILNLARKLGEGSESLLAFYFDSAQNLYQQLKPHRVALRDFMRIDWQEVRRHLERLGERQILSVETVRGLLAWFDPPAGARANNLIIAIRDDAVAGLIDFISKGTHSQEVRSELARFLGEVISRSDERMLQVLAIQFQNYQLGMMRDRFQIQNSPSADPLHDQLAMEAYDEFLHAIRATAQFYHAHPRTRGFFLDIFLKLQGDRNDPNFQLAVPVLHRTQELFDAQYTVNLVSRGGIGESVITATHPDGSNKVIAVTSIVDPLENRQQLEVWLRRAERELLHNGELAETENGRPQRFISIHLPRIESGVAKDSIRQWVGDYLIEHSRLDGIDIYLPDKGNQVADVADRSFYRRVSVTADNVESTEVLIDRLKTEVEENPQDLRRRLELYRLRKSWLEHRTFALKNGKQPRNRAEQEELLRNASELSGLENANWVLLQETARMFPKEKAVQTEFNRELEVWFQGIAGRDWNYITMRRPFGGRAIPDSRPLTERQSLFIDFLDSVFGVRLKPERVVNLINLRLADAEISDFYYNFSQGVLTLRGDIHDISEQTNLEFGEGPPTIRQPSDLPPQPEPTIDGRVTGVKVETVPSDTVEIQAAPEVENGHFNLSIQRNRRSGQIEIHFDHVRLPLRMRGRAIGRNFFGEVIRLGTDLGAEKIVSEEITDEGRHKLALYGMSFRDRAERQKMLRHFRYFLEFQMQIPGFNDYDLSEIDRIRTPQQLAHAFLDPDLRALSLEPPPDPSSVTWRRTLPGHHYVGRLYLMNSAPSWSGVFNLAKDSESLRIFHAYYDSRMRERINVLPGSFEGEEN